MASTYVLGRDYKSASRLNYEHYLWKETIAFSLHPNIVLTTNNSTGASEGNQCALIADVACGTAIWLRDVAQTFPNAQLDGFDISLAQCPPAKWLPRNVTLRQWDLFSEPPAELLGRYDVVHVRLVFVVVENDDPRPLIRSLSRLLRPGGYLQWDELNVGKSFILSAEEVTETPEMAGMLGILGRMGSWVEELPRMMEDCGLVEGKLYRYREREELARAFFDNHLAKDEEMAQTALKGTKEGEQLVERVRKMYEESKGGAVLCTPKLVSIARKPQR